MCWNDCHRFLDVKLSSVRATGASRALALPSGRLSFQLVHAVLDVAVDLFTGEGDDAPPFRAEVAHAVPSFHVLV
jgi:hypothetical protein